MNSTELSSELQIAMRAKIPVIAIITKDEQKSSDVVTIACKAIGRNITSWSATGKHNYSDKSITIDDLMGEIDRSTSMTLTDPRTYVIYDLLDFMRTNPVIKRKVYDFIKTPRRITIITFASEPTNDLRIYAPYHSTGLSRDEIIEGINTAMMALRRQKEHIEEMMKSEDSDALKTAKTKIDSVYLKLHERLSSDEYGEITDAFIGLQRHQLEHVISKCIINADITPEYIKTAGDLFTRSYN
jgi:hypothetical protein